MNQSPRYNPSQHANVCLLLEGTYPYIRGGVSTWVRQLIEGMPEARFSLSQSSQTTFTTGKNPSQYS